MFLVGEIMSELSCRLDAKSGRWTDSLGQLIEKGKDFGV